MGADQDGREPLDVLRQLGLRVFGEADLDGEVILIRKKQIVLYDRAVPVQDVVSSVLDVWFEFGP